MGLFRKLWADADAINDYFAGAVYVYLYKEDAVARFAALTAAKVMRGAQRASNVNWLRMFAAGVQAENPNAAYRLNQLADEISLKNWGLRDAVDAKRALAQLDGELEQALAYPDPGIFDRRFPELFREIRGG